MSAVRQERERLGFRAPREVTPSPACSVLVVLAVAFIGLLFYVVEKRGETQWSVLFTGFIFTMILVLLGVCYSVSDGPSTREVQFSTSCMSHAGSMQRNMDERSKQKAAAMSDMIASKVHHRVEKSFPDFVSLLNNNSNNNRQEIVLYQIRKNLVYYKVWGREKNSS